MQTEENFDLFLGEFFIRNRNPMWVYDENSMHFLAVNPAAISKYGYTEAEFLSIRMQDLIISDETIESILQSNEKLENAEKEHLVEQIKKDGSRIWVKIASYKTTFKGKHARLLTAIDFTQFKNQKSLLKEKNLELETLSLVARYTNNLLLITDEEGKILWANNAFLETMKFSIQEIFNFKPSELFHGPLSSQNTTLKIKTAIKNKQPFKEQIIHYTKEQQPVWILADGQPIFDDKNRLIKYVIVETNITSHKNQEEKLNRSESELHAFFNSSGSILLLFDNALKITAFNKRASLFAKKYFNISIQIGSLALDFIESFSKEKFRQFALSALSGNGIENYEMKLNGTEIWWSIRFLPIYDSFGIKKGASFTAIDISERKRAELLLIQSEERYNLVSKATFDAIWDWDIEKNTLYRGEGFDRLFGYEFGTLTNDPSNWDELIHEDDFKRVITDFKKVLESNVSNWIEEYKFLKADGSYAFVRDKAIIIRDENGIAKRMVGAMQDISLQVQREQQLKLFESAVTETTDAVVITDALSSISPGSIIEYVNDAFTKMTGYSAGEVIGKSPRMLQGMLTDQGELTKLRTAINKWEPCEIETVNYKKNGEPFWVNISIIPVANDKGEYTNWIAIQKDVTERRKVLEERENMIQELTRNNIELKQFSYITTHNLRAPLTNMLGIFGLLDYTKIHDQRTLQLIEGLKSSTDNLNDTLTDLIKILIIKENAQIKLAQISFQIILNQVIESINHEIQNSGAVIKSDFSKAEEVEFSHVYLQSIFLNLISNAIKYRIPNITPIIQIKSTIVDHCVQLRISDNGLGMDWDKIKNKVFGLYQKFHHNSDSKGIGLYLVQAQVTALGGKIELFTKINQGTEFIITFKNRSPNSL